jgi:hypothetical protein
MPFKKYISLGTIMLFKCGMVTLLGLWTIDNIYLKLSCCKIRDKGKLVSAWQRGGREGEGKGGERNGGEGRRNGPNIVCTYE